MQFMTLRVTPKQAEAFLLNNANNRPLNKAVAHVYANDMRRGEWKLTHQPVLIGKGGALIDGQHRLYAVVLANVPVEMCVAFSDAVESPLGLPVDVGLKRKESYILAEDSALIAIARFAAHIIERRPNFSPSEIGAWVAKFKSAYSFLLSKGKTAKRGLSTSETQLAAMIHIMRGHYAEYARDTYHDLVAVKTDGSLSPLAQSYLRQIVFDRVGLDQRQRFARAVKVFDYERRNLKKMLVQNEQVAFEEARYLLSKVVSPTSEL